MIPDFVQTAPTFYTNTQTGEVISTEEHDLRELGKQVKERGALLELKKADLAEQRLAVDALIRAHFPNLRQQEQEVAELEEEFLNDIHTMRQLALFLHEDQGSKSFLSGALTVALYDRTTSYNEAEALAWCEEMRPDLIKRSADKKKLELLAKTGAMPSEVIVVEKVAETRFTFSKLEG